MNYIKNQHNDHITWMKELAFYEDELKIFNTKLQEISAANTHLEVKQNVEKFHNQFKIQKLK